MVMEIRRAVLAETTIARAMPLSVARPQHWGQISQAGDQILQGRQRGHEAEAGEKM
jgi:hypothetical protein